MSDYSLPRPVRIWYRRLFFLFPQANSLAPDSPPSRGRVVAYGLTRGHATRRLLVKIDPDMFWPGTVTQFYLK